MDLIVQDFEEINIERPQMVAKLFVNLEQGMQKGLINNQSSGVAACARQIISLAGLAANSNYNHDIEKLSSHMKKQEGNNQRNSKKQFSDSFLFQKSWWSQLSKGSKEQYLKDH